MKNALQQLLGKALESLQGSVIPGVVDPSIIVLERTRDAAHGDFASNVAMRLAKSAGRNPRELAQAIIAALPTNALIDRAEIAGAGFINFFLVKDLYARELVRVHETGERYGRGTRSPAPAA